MKIKNYKIKPGPRLQAALESLPDDEIFTAVELSGVIGIPWKVIANQVGSHPDNNFSDGATRWWGSKKAIVAAKEEILNRGNQKA